MFFAVTITIAQNHFQNANVSALIHNVYSFDVRISTRVWYKSKNTHTRRSISKPRWNAAFQI